MNTKNQRGMFAVEFSFTFLLFLTILLSILEVSRAIYIWNSLQEVTRRAARDAAATDFTNATALDELRRSAVFDQSAGRLPFGQPVTSQHIVIDYMSLQDQSDGSMTRTAIPTGSLPGCPTRNRMVCTGDAGDASCIRFVRVRVCKPGTNCEPVPYSTIFSLVKLPVALPTSESIVKAESLGYTAGAPMCN